MSSEQFDSSDSLMGFASETATALTQDSEPAFTSPTLGDAHHSIFSLDHQQPPRFRAWPIATFSVVIGILVGFAAGYVFAHRVAMPATESASIPTSSGSSQRTRAERSTESVNGPNVVAPALPTDVSAISVPSTPSSTTSESRISSPESRLSTAARRRPAVVPTRGHEGVIEVLSHPQGAQVLLDGKVVGRTPLAVADVPEGTHEVRLEISGFHPWVTSVRVNDGSRARVGASLEP